MSGSRAKKQRERPARIVNAEFVVRSADAVLGVDLRDMRFRSRTDQVVVGLCRAAFAQSRVVAALAKADMLSAAAPNRRLVLEVALRLPWLRGLSAEEGRKAVDTMLAKDRQDTNRLRAYLRDAGHDADFDPTEMDAFELDDEAKGAIHQQSTRLNAAVDSNEVKPWSIYSMWLAETQFSHASGNLAGQYAPTVEGLHMSSGAPDPMDQTSRPIVSSSCTSW
ncbi:MULTISPECIES: hypothetical protein [unclassified Rathayibacter]|uniref:hypothetical protein n=1 Tax=unclassified Rathayibacter TaxID=2609250 RepID=UPI0011B09486|nr:MULTISPECIES: hypothetical protein [unclassified Rathayibacter]